MVVLILRLKRGGQPAPGKTRGQGRKPAKQPKAGKTRKVATPKVPSPIGPGSTRARLKANKVPAPRPGLQPA